MAKKSRIAWNKGLTKEMDERVRKGAERLSISVKGRVPWNKGLTVETDERVKKYVESSRKSLKGRKSWNEGLTAKTDSRLAIAGKKAKENRIKKGSYKGWNKGLTKETDERVRLNGLATSKSRKGKTWDDMYGKEQADIYRAEAKVRLLGILPKLNLPYGLEWIGIRKSVLERDGYICQVCGKTITNSDKVHHIIPYRVIKKHDRKYLVSVCNKCHLKVEPKAIPTEEITDEWYINYYTIKGGKLPLETTRRTSLTDGDIVRTVDIEKTTEMLRNKTSL